MHITFLIGNGFDRNLGLNTAYSDFVKVYKELKSKSEHITKFREHIKENEELWSKAEEALGKYTRQLEKGQGAVFSECQEDFCINLAQYLIEQERRIAYTESKEAIQKTFKQFARLSEPLSTVERSKINEVYQKRSGEDFIFDFINFNYTRTLDQCLQIVNESPGLLGAHSNSGVQHKHSVGKICHVHGTVEGQMVFGVNDDSQIDKPEVFEGSDGELSKALLIKKEANASYRENTDAKAAQILNASSIIYIYGMALGITDTLWWERICAWLSENENHHMILHQYKMPKESALPFKRLNFELRIKREFMKLGKLSEAKYQSVGDQIHITGYNIFEPIENIAFPLAEIEKFTIENDELVAVP